MAVIISSGVDFPLITDVVVICEKRELRKQKNRNMLTDKSIAFHFSHETHGIKKGLLC